MKTFIIRSLLTILGIGLFACSSSKFDYQSAYKFRIYDSQKPGAEAEVPPVNVLASTNPNFEPVPVSPREITILKPENKAKISNQVVVKSTPSKMTRAKKKAFRQDIKQQLKKIAKDRKIERKEAKKKGAQMNRKIYTGLIIAGAGIVVAILASGAIGGLAIIVGVALIAWGLIEQGSF